MVIISEKRGVTIAYIVFSLKILGSRKIQLAVKHLKNKVFTNCLRAVVVCIIQLEIIAQSTVRNTRLTWLVLY